MASGAVQHISNFSIHKKNMTTSYCCGGATSARPQIQNPLSTPTNHVSIMTLFASQATYTCFGNLP